MKLSVKKIVIGILFVPVFGILGFVSYHILYASSPKIQAVSGVHRPYAGGLSEKSEYRTNDDVYIADHCEETPDSGLFNCLITNKHPDGYRAWRLSTHNYPKGEKVIVVIEHNERDGTDLFLVEQFDPFAAAASGIK